MVLSGQTVVDIDVHHYDRWEDIYQYLDDDDPWKRKFEKAEEMDSNDGIASFFPKITYNLYSDGAQRPRYHSKQDLIDTMDRMGVDKLLTIGQQMLQLGSIHADDERPIKYSEAYVDYLLDNIADPSQGIYITVPIVHSDPEKAVELIERVGDEESVAAVCIVSKGPQPPLGNRKFDPLWEACVKYDLPAIVHAGGSSLDGYHLAGFESALETHTLGFLAANMSQLASIVVQGVPEKFPELDLLFIESGLMYVPMMMWRLDQEYLRMPEEAPLLTKRPSEYLKEFYYGTQPVEIVPDTKYMEWTIEMIGGADRLMWASDWPHNDHDEPDAVSEKMPFLSEEERGKILGRNAEQVFGIEGGPVRQRSESSIPITEKAEDDD